MLDLGMVGSPADVATLVVVLVLYRGRLQPAVGTLSAAVVALANNHRDVDHERLQADLDVSDVELNAVRPTVPDGAGGLPDGPTEASTSRDGVLSYAGEWHALVIGAGAGLAAAATGTWVLVVVVAGASLGLEVARRSPSTVEKGTLPWVGEVRKEPWYALGGLLAGVPIGLLVGPGLPL